MGIANNFFVVYDALINLSITDFVKIKDLINDIQDSIENSEISNRSYCPLCGSPKLKKNGKTAAGIQKYKCISCKQYFSEFTKTPFSNSKIFKKMLPLIIYSLYCNHTIRASAKYLEVDKKTAYSWRMKLLEIIGKKFDKSCVLSDEVQVDETFYPINLKGTKPKDMPRESKKRGTPVTNSNEMICIPTAIDSSKNLVMKAIGTNSISYKRLESVLGYRISENAKLITDGGGAYVKFSKKHKLEQHIVDTNTHKSIEGYNINTVNGIHSEFKMFLAQFRGVSVYHLQEYIVWFRVNKYLKNNNKEKNIKFIKDIIKSAKKIKIGFDDCYKKQPVVSLIKAYGKIINQSK